VALKLTITREDAKRGQLVDPGWYQAKVKDITAEQSGDKTSITYHVSLVVITPGPYQDVPIKYWISEKAPSMGIPLLNACGAAIDPENFAGSDFDLENCIGKIVDIAVENEEYNKRMGNKVKDFAPAGSQTRA
jgi:hypothetical protein